MNNQKLIQKLESLPTEIKIQTLNIMDRQAEVDILREKINSIKVSAMEKVLTDGGATNDKARATAQAKILENDSFYQDQSKTLRLNEMDVRIAQAQLELLHNQFRAYIAIASIRAYIAIAGIAEVKS